VYSFFGEAGRRASCWVSCHIVATWSVGGNIVKVVERWQLDISIGLSCELEHGCGETAAR
jgi:hypothetical protein